MVVSVGLYGFDMTGCSGQSQDTVVVQLSDGGRVEVSRCMPMIPTVVMWAALPSARLTRGTNSVKDV